MNSPIESRSNGFPMAVIVEGSLVLVAMALAWLFDVPLRDQFPPMGPPLWAATGRGVLATLPMLAAFWWLVHSSRPALRALREQVEWLVSEMFSAASYVQLGFIALLAGVGEELLFRGAIQTIFGQWTNPHFGLVLASLLFGLVHALSKLYFVLATLIGLFLGWMALAYNDLIAPMIAHGLYDFLALAYLLRKSRLRLSAGNDPPPAML